MKRLGVILLLIGLAAAGPVAMQAARLRAAVPKDAERLARMRANVQEILQLRAEGVSGAAEGASLAGIDGAVDQAGLRGFLAGVTQNGTDGIVVNFQRVPFSRLLWWMDQVRTHRGLRVERATLQMADAGTVDAQVQLR